jgi:hypothetical protein
MLGGSGVHPEDGVPGHEGIYGDGGDEHGDIMIEEGGDDMGQYANHEEYQRMLMENGVVVDVGEIEFDDNEYGDYGFEQQE